MYNKKNYIIEKANSVLEPEKALNLTFRNKE